MICKQKAAELRCIQWNGDNLQEVKDFLGDAYNNFNDDIMNEEYKHTRMILQFKTHECFDYVYKGDYIIKTPLGDFYPCRKELFCRLYDVVDWENETTFI